MSEKTKQQEAVAKIATLGGNEPTLDLPPPGKISFLTGILYRVPLMEKILFAKHLSIMIKSGMGESESLRVIRSQVKSKTFGRILDKVIVKLENGQFLSDGLSKYVHHFGQLFVSMIRIGELSGTLSQNLEYLSVEMRKSYQLRSKTRSALIYPAVILVATIGVIAGLVFFILPKILPIFTSLRVTLPITTRILIAVTNAMHAHILLILGTFIGAVAFWVFITRIRAVRFFLHRVMLSLPILGPLAIEYNMSTITRTMGILLKSGIKIVESLGIASDIVTNLVYKKELAAVAERVRRGGMMYEHFETLPNVFPGTAARMIEVGERTGSLESNLFYLAEFYENEVDEKLQNLSSTLEPVLLVIMGAMVGFVALAIITPIYGITQKLGGQR